MPDAAAHRVVHAASAAFSPMPFLVISLVIFGTLHWPGHCFERATTTPFGPSAALSCPDTLAPMMDGYLARKQENFRRVIASIGKPDGSLKTDAHPILLHLEITSRCNLRCLKCGHATDDPDSPRIQPRHLSYAIIESFDEYFASLRASSIRLASARCSCTESSGGWWNGCKFFGCAHSRVDGITNWNAGGHT